MRIHVITFSAEYPRTRYSVKKKNARLAGLSQVDRQLREWRAARRIRLHDREAARAECNVDIFESLRRNDLRYLNVSSEIVNQAGTDVKRRHHEQHDLRIQVNQADQHGSSEQRTTGTGFVDVKFFEAVIPYGTDHQKGHKQY